MRITRGKLSAARIRDFIYDVHVEKLSPNWTVKEAATAANACPRSHRSGSSPHIRPGSSRGDVEDSIRSSLASTARPSSWRETASWTCRGPMPSGCCAQTVRPAVLQSLQRAHGEASTFVLDLALAKNTTRPASTPAIGSADHSTRKAIIISATNGKRRQVESRTSRCCFPNT